ncbi:uroporphyrinogen-III C-methyltransferase [Patulibacter sp.]|uniref:uroporphyrinogen-III C-methyltransferase n=1 Tax=Patulibacter sp. TaxID=1912859 RepID=UPI00271713F1|nr:uroporphyrinogen-III C-methyltransferase [Patulibacter sp.]MDO9408008.1 uroporphyrinogen-III C-methyltransferase [Patulibacter sp.]
MSTSDDGRADEAQQDVGAVEATPGAASLAGVGVGGNAVGDTRPATGRGGRGDDPEADLRTDAAILGPLDEAPEPGTAYLIGAGPGDPGLMTVRALEVIASADVVLYDQLIPATALDGVRPDALLLDVGKRGGGKQVPQAETEDLLLGHVLAGRSVARVKGGDPFVFGRGGEEAQRLRAKGVPYEVVPGVTAGIAGPAYAGIPVTHREHAAGVAFVTGHEDPKKPESSIDWEGLARFPGTLVFYMGVRRLPAIAGSLIGAGRPEDQPAAVVQSGTVGAQRVVTGTLATIADVAAAAGIKAPAVTVVGGVAGLRDELRWFEDRPLFGRTVAVTRARAQASGLARRLRALGAEVVETPTIRTRSLGAEVPDLVDVDVLALTSPNGVREFMEALLRSDRDARSLYGTMIAAVGPGTARALKAHGIVADVVPETYTGEALAALIGGSPAPSGQSPVTGASVDPVGARVDGRPGRRPRRALLVRAATAGDALPDGLRAAGIEVTDLAVYETVAEPLSASALDALRGVDYVTFTSASTAGFLAQAGDVTDEDAVGPHGRLPVGPRTRAVSIGPVTTAALAELGAVPAVEAREATIDGLVDALVRDATTRED